MNLPVFIANRLSGKDKENLSGPVIRIAVITIALGLSVMILAVAVLVGFQTQIRNKVTGFSAHIQIDNFDANASYESSPVSMDQPFYPELEEVDGIKHIQVFTLKAGIIKTEDQLQGVVLKGIGPDYDWGFLKEHLTSGSVFRVDDTMASGDILISGMISRKLQLKVGDEVVISGPYGNFTYDSDDIVMLAGGSGITPMMSHIRRNAETKAGKYITLFYSARTEKDMVFRKEIDAIQRVNPNIKFVPIITREKPEGFACETKRIDLEMVRRYLKEPEKKCYLVCGPADFAGNVANILGELKIPGQNIKKEFWG